jgi:hypothetical protein
MECDMAFFAKAVGNEKLSMRFTRAAEARRRAFEAILWNESMGQWLDYWLPLHKPADVRKVIFCLLFTKRRFSLLGSSGLSCTNNLSLLCVAEYLLVGQHQVEPKHICIELCASVVQHFPTRSYLLHPLK